MKTGSQFVFCHQILSSMVIVIAPMKIPHYTGGSEVTTWRIMQSGAKRNPIHPLNFLKPATVTTTAAGYRHSLSVTIALRTIAAAATAFRRYSNAEIRGMAVIPVKTTTPTVLWAAPRHSREDTAVAIRTTPVDLRGAPRH